jgi:hypothetical protein
MWYTFDVIIPPEIKSDKLIISFYGLSRLNQLKGSQHFQPFSGKYFFPPRAMLHARITTQILSSRF